MGRGYTAGPRAGIPGFLIAFAALGLREPLHLGFPSPPGFAPVQLALGSLLLAAGVAWIAWGLQTLRRATRQDRLATGGPFRCCRHPLYFAWCFLIFPAWALLADCWPILLAAGVMLVIFHFTLDREEADIRARFAETYEAYRQRVPRRILPSLRPPHGDGNSDLA